MKRTFLIAAAAVFVILLAAVLIFWIMSPRDTELEVPDHDSKYPCTVIYRGDEVRVTVRGGKTSYSWEAVCGAYLASEKQKGGEGETVFRFKPAGTGSYSVTLALEKQEGIPDTAYTLWFDFEWDGKAFSLPEAGHTEFPEMIMGEGDAYALSFIQETSMTVFLPYDPAANWQVLSEDGRTAVDYRSVPQEDENEDTADAEQYESIRLVFSGNEPTIFYILSRDLDLAYEVRMDYTGEQGFYPSAHKILKYSDLEITAEQRLPSSGGNDWITPAGASQIAADTVTWETETRSVPAEYLLFAYKDSPYKMYGIEALTPEEVTGTESAELEAAFSQTGVWCGTVVDKTLAVWVSKNRVYVLLGAGTDVDAETLTATASECKRAMEA